MVATDSKNNVLDGIGPFEGQEKRLQLHFKRSAHSVVPGNKTFRSISRPEWSSMLELAQCSILNAVSNVEFDAYLLSESSLFVHDEHLMIKTCGETTLLYILPKLLEVGFNMGLIPSLVRFTHSELLYPSKQPFPHQEFSDEVEYLRRFFPCGEAAVLGETAKAVLHLFVAAPNAHPEEIVPSCPAVPPTLEVIMGDLDHDAMLSFVGGPDAGTAGGSPQFLRDLRESTGVASLMPDADAVDDFMFDPCGYSLNAVEGADLYSIHVTPQEPCRFVSFETSKIPAAGYGAYVQQVSSVFRPKRFSAFVTLPAAAPSTDAVMPEHTGYALRGRSEKVVCGLRVLGFEYAEEAAGTASPTSPASPVSPAALPPPKYSQKHAIQATRDGLIEGMVDTLCKEFPVRDVRGGLAAAAAADGGLTYAREALGWHGDCEDPFYVVDLSAVVRQYEQWVGCLPRVRPFYAVKCNPDPAILQLLHRLGCGFDTASKGEINRVKALGVPSTSMVYANPCKMASHLRFARQQDVRRMTFDNAAELRKIAREFPSAELILRVVTDDAASICRFSNKFGAHMPDVLGLLELAKELGLNVIGVSFHVGSGCQSTDTFVDSLQRARTAFNHMEALGMSPSLLDIGGGFPGNEDNDGGISFPEIANVVRPLIDELFPPHVEVIAEPGRYFAAASHHLVAHVYAKRHVPADEEAKTEEGFNYYINDGVYASFNCIFFDHAKPKGTLVASDAKSRPSFPSTVFGPTCDGLDTLLTGAMLPEMSEGDWMHFAEMGAYTRAAASDFNGYLSHKTYYVRS